MAGALSWYAKGSALSHPGVAFRLMGMQRNTTTPSLDEVASELGGWLVGAGILTMMLFPFMVPILLLTAAAVLPLLAPLLLLGVFAAPVLIVRAASRAVRRANGHRIAASAGRLSVSDQTTTS